MTVLPVPGCRKPESGTNQRTVTYAGIIRITALLHNRVSQQSIAHGVDSALSGINAESSNERVGWEEKIKGLRLKAFFSSCDPVRIQT